MKAIITNDKLKIQDNTLYNSGSIQYYEIDVEFSSDWEGLTKYAVLVGADKIKLPVVANKLHVDQRTSGTYTIGFVGYTLEDDEKVYQISTNLECIYFQTGAGEIEANEPSDLPDPTTWETYLSEIQAIVDGAENVNITSEKVGDTTYITTTDKTGTTETVEVLDGKDAKINGVNTITVEGGANVSIEQEGSTLIISATDTTDYEELSNKPKINNVELDGNKSLSDLGIIYPVTSVNSQTGDVTIFVPTKLSDLSNDTGFITNLVDNLANYYLKTEIYTKQEVTALINAIQKVTITIVQELPTTGDSNVIYFVPKTGSGNDTYNEYIYISNNWEKIGDTDVDLSNYYTKSQTDNLLNNKIEGLKIGNTTQEIDNKIIEITPDTTPVEDSTNVIDSNAVYELENMLPTDTTTGDISNAQPYKVLDIVADGKYQQDTTTGKNLFDETIITSKTVNGVTAQYNNNKIRISGTSNGGSNIAYSYRIPNEWLGKTMTISVTGATIGTGVFNVGFKNSGSGVGLTIAFASQTKLTATITQNMIDSVNQFSIWVTPNSIANADINLQVEEGSTATSYEPYTGGIASPNPDFPQPITQVTSATWNRTGKNLYSSQNEQNAWNNSNGTSTYTSNNYVRSSDFIKVQPNTTYTINFSINGTTNKFGNILSYGANQNFINSITIEGNLTFTTSNSTYYLKFNFYHTSVITPSDVTNVQLEPGSTATPYSPYQGQSIPIDLDGNEVCSTNITSTNTIKDKLLVDRYGNVALQKNVGKVVLNGSEYWDINTSTDTYYEFQASIFSPSAISGYSFPISNYFSNKTNNRIVANGAEVLIRVPSSTNITTVEQFKTWLSTHNTTIYYALATPQIIPLPKLSILPSTLKGINHIWVDTNLGRTDIEVEYVEDLQAEIDALRAMIGG